MDSEVPKTQGMNRSVSAEQQDQDNDGNDNLRDNKVDVEIEPETIGNVLHVNLCSCVCTFST